MTEMKTISVFCLSLTFFWPNNAYRLQLVKNYDQSSSLSKNILSYRLYYNEVVSILNYSERMRGILSSLMGKKSNPLWFESI